MTSGEARSCCGVMGDVWRSWPDRQTFAALCRGQGSGPWTTATYSLESGRSTWASSPARATPDARLIDCQLLLLLKAPQVATQNGTAYVSGICQSNLEPPAPAASIAPWLMATRTVPTTRAVAAERRSIGP